MKSTLVLGLICLTLFIGYNCFNNQVVTRNFGGQMTINLSPGEKLEEITWKGDSLWILTRDRDATKEEPRTYHFREHASLNFLEGGITIVEH